MSSNTPSPTLEVRVHALKNLSPEYTNIFHNEIVPLLSKVINSQEFRNRVSGYQYIHKKVLHDGYAYTTDTPIQVLNTLLDGRETARLQEADNTLDIYQTYYWSRKNTIGYTYPSTWHTWVNKRYFTRYITNRAKHHNIVANIVHEWMHNLGYKHPSKRTPTRRYSVPYAVGDIAGEVAKDITLELSSGGTPENYEEKELRCYRPWWGLGLIKRCWYE